MSDKQTEHTANIIAIKEEKLKDNRAKLLRARRRRRLPLFGTQGFDAFAADNDRVERGESAAAIVRDNLILPVMVNEAEQREIRIAEAASAILQVEIETGEVLNEAQTTELLASYASVDYRALANPGDRTWIVTQGQVAALVPEIDLESIPPPAWLASLQNDVRSAMNAIRNRIIPFELIDRIRYYLDPTPEQLDERVAGRQAREEQQRRMIHNMDDLLVRIKTVVADHPGYAEAKEFAKYFSCGGEGNMYITSLEAHCRMDTRQHKKLQSKKLKQKSASQDPTNWFGPRMGKTAKRSPRKTGFTGLRPAALQSSLQEILRLSGEADDILRSGFGITARFAVWSQYGPGPAGLSRLFLIYDGVIEPQSKARILDPEVNADLVTALGVLTAQVEGQAIVADAAAEAFISRPAAQTEIIEQIATQWAPAFAGQEQFEPNARGSLINIPVVDAYRAWSAALWTQSHLTHEQKVSPDILAAHCRMIEFRLGREGRHYRRSINCPTFYELNIQGPLQQVYQTFTNFCSRRIASVEGGTERVCNYLGINDAGIELAQEMTPHQRADRLVAIVARARAQARRRRIRDLINGVGAHAQAIFNSAAVTTTIAVAQGASARAAQGAVEAGTQSVNYSIRTAPIIAAAIAEQSAAIAEQSGRKIIPSIETHVVAAGGGLRQGIEVIVGHAAGIVQQDGQIIVNAHPLQVPSSGLNNIENAIGNSDLAAQVPTAAIVEQFVGGGIRLRLNAPVGEATMTVSPVVLLEPTDTSPLQITTSLNAGLTMQDEAVLQVIAGEAPVPVVAEEVDEDDEDEEEEASAVGMGDQGLGIYNKRKTTHRTKKYIRGKKGCKGTKKGCKGKKGRGKGSKRRGTSNKGMPTDTMRILKQKLKL